MWVLVVGFVQDFVGFAISVLAMGRWLITMQLLGTKGADVIA